MNINISVLGIDHKYSAEIREKVAFSESQKIEFSTKLIDLGVEEVVILSTCNRSEVYFLDEWKNDAVRNQVLQTYIEYFDIAEYRDCIYKYYDLDAVNHIFRVTAGLESAIVGEDEILRQIKEAYEFSHQFKNTGKFFNKLFQEAIKSAKEIKSKLKISEIPLSTGYIGLKYLESQAETFVDKTLLIIGFGEIGKLFFQYGKELPFQKILLCNRSEHKVQNAVDNYDNVSYLPYLQRYEGLKEADIAIVATTCPHLIIKKNDVPSREKPIYLLDMAIPRNIETTLTEKENYHLFNIDVLKEMSAKNEASRKALTVKAEDIINSAIDEYIHWLRFSSQDNIIESLNQSVDEILNDHLEYLFKRIDTTEREQKIISRTMQSALKKAVRNPIVALKTIQDKEKRTHYSEVLGELFQLNGKKVD